MQNEEHEAAHFIKAMCDGHYELMYEGRRTHRSRSRRKKRGIMSKLKRFLTTGNWSDFGADETDSQYRNHKNNRASSFTSASSSRFSKSSKRSNSEV